MRMRTNLEIATCAALALLSFPLGGCGGAGAGNDPSDAPSSSEHEQMLAWAQCLREQGLKVEDPEPGQGVQLKGADGDEVFEQALAACQDLEPGGEAEDPDAAREEMLKAARCMREHGVEAFADPKPGEGLNVDPEVVEDPDFESAQQACLPGAPPVERNDAP